MKKLLLLIILVSISLSQSFAQYTIEKMEGFYYNGEQIRKQDVKKMILESDNSEAIDLMKKYERVRTVGFVALGTGYTLMVAGTISHVNNFINWFPTEADLRNIRRADRMFFTGLFLTIGSAIPLLVSKKTTYRNSINAFNKGQKTRAEVSLQSGPDGIGLKLKF